MYSLEIDDDSVELWCSLSPGEQDRIVAMMVDRSEERFPSGEATNHSVNRVSFTLRVDHRARRVALGGLRKAEALV